MAERTIDRLLPGATALVFGTVALAAGLGGIAADMMIGRTSASSGVGFVLMLPVAVFAAVVGFAIGYGAGAWAKSHGVNTMVPMKPYRIVMAFVLGVATVIGATLGARPVMRHERLYRPRVMVGEGAVAVQAGQPESCVLDPAYVACDSSLRVTSTTLPWNGRDVVVACTREGRVSMSDQSGAPLGVIDLSDFDHVRRVAARAVRRADGREALAVLASLRPNGTRHLFSLLDQDGRVIYQEMRAGALPAQAHQTALHVCERDDPPSIVLDLDGPVTYRAR